MGAYQPFILNLDKVMPILVRDPVTCAVRGSHVCGACR